MIRRTRNVLAVSALALAFLVPAAAPQTNNSKFTIDITQVAPRQVEDATEQAVLRDYSKAWENMAKAMEQNRADLLNASFTGFARERLGQSIDQQKSNGLTRKYVDRGHKLEVVFYSVEGSALQLRDTAQLELQLLDGNKVVHSEQVTLHYIAVLTPAENSWKVRMLEEVEGF